MRAANTTRGEVRIDISGVPLILCAEMSGLDALDHDLELGLAELLRSIMLLRPRVIRKIIEHLTITGDAAAALAAYDRLSGPKLVEELVRLKPLLQSLFVQQELEGNAEAAEEAASG